MSLSTSRFASGVSGVLTLDGVDVRDLAGGELVSANRTFAEVFVELKRLYAPVAAQIAARSAPGAGGLARSQGFGSPEQMVAAGLGGTLAEARMLIEAGRTVLDAEPENDDDDEDSGGEDAPSYDDEELAEAERERQRLETERREAERERAREERARAREAARRAALTPLARALEDGEITADAAAVIRTTLEGLIADTDDLRARKADVEATLVRRALRSNLGRLRSACDRAAAGFDAAQTHARATRLFEGRGVFLTPQADGSVRLSGSLDLSTAAGVMAFCTAYVTREFRAARDLDIPETRTAPQMRADALALMAEHLIGCTAAPTGVTTTILVEVDLDSLVARGGLATNHTTGTTMDAGHLRRWCAETGVIPAVLGGPSQPLDLGRAQRLASPAQKLALVARDGACVWCGAPPAWCDAHHLRHWSDGGDTDLDNMALLCWSCHTRIHTTDWTITRRHGRTWIIPPAHIDPDRTPMPAARERTGTDGNRPGAPPPAASTQDADARPGGDGAPEEERSPSDGGAHLF
ncbi:DUF222 domain-containing protein [Demequina sp. SYSU T00068]|uniref:HNH endonuclease signature motif containing protein n=1 Tax=Demequina lignilytica TaxID=3051663 RepID=UPI0026121C26|nr:HNH endonuclease signature motif containing protein [Demequina sp. SYSU T00068]MDN4489771.1 DUF222 domain-containing protein [Demequina sp. SYSU T00068]